MAKITGTNSANKLIGTASADSIFGLGGNDTLLGGAGADTIRGGSGNDRITGDNGNDKLYGESGNDTFIALDNDGNDRFDGGAGTDTVDYSRVTQNGNVVLDLGNAFGPSGGAAGDTFFFVENVTGTSSGDFISGNSLNNVVTGGAGIDTLFGRAGFDTLLGGDGDDTLYPGDDADADTVNGGDGNDFVSYGEITTGSGVKVNLENSTGPDTYISIENILGSQNDDVLTVFNGHLVNGDKGNDTVSGSTNSNFQTIERLAGGLGADNFRLHLNTGYDIVGDLSSADGDKLQISNSEFGTANASNLINVFGQVTATFAGPQFIYDTFTRVLYFDADGTGLSEGPVAVAALPNFVGALTAGQFDFIT